MDAQRLFKSSLARNERAAFFTTRDFCGLAARKDPKFLAPAAETRALCSPASEPRLLHLNPPHFRFPSQSCLRFLQEGTRP